MKIISFLSKYIFTKGEIGFDIVKGFSAVSPRVITKNTFILV